MVFLMPASASIHLVLQLVMFESYLGARNPLIKLLETSHSSGAQPSE